MHPDTWWFHTSDWGRKINCSFKSKLPRGADDAKHIVLNLKFNNIFFLNPLKPPRTSSVLVVNSVQTLRYLKPKFTICLNYIETSGQGFGHSPEIEAKVKYILYYTVNQLMLSTKSIGYKN
jgi:hypothetical protein